MGNVFSEKIEMFKVYRQQMQSDIVNTGELKKKKTMNNPQN